MSKIHRQFIDLVFGSSTSLRAQDIPFDATNSILIHINTKLPTLAGNNSFSGNNSFHQIDISGNGIVSNSENRDQIFSMVGTPKLTISSTGVKINGNLEFTGNSFRIFRTGSTNRYLEFEIADEKFTFTAPVVASGPMGYFEGNGALITNINATNISSGTIPDARISSDIPRKSAGNNIFEGNMTVDDMTVGGTLYASGAGISDINAYAISTGKLNDARLSSNVPLKNAANSFSGNNVFNTNSGSLTIAAVSIGEPTLSFSHSGIATDGTIALEPWSDRFVLNKNLHTTGTISGASFTGSGSGLTSLPAHQLTGTIPDGRVGDNIPRLDAGSNEFEGDASIAGDLTVVGELYALGTNIEAIPAGNITSGTLSDARLSANVARRNQANTFTATQTFNNAITANAPGASTHVFNQNSNERLRVMADRVRVMGRLEVRGTYYTFQRETTSSTTWNLDTDGILFVHPQGASSHIEITMPPDGIGVNVCAVVTIYVISNSGSYNISLISPTGAAFRGKSGYHPITMTIPSSIGRAVICYKAYAEWRVIENY